MPDSQRLNFGITKARYYASQDWNGDGITDLAKFLTPCESIKRSCLNRTTTGNFFINSTDGSTTLSASQGSTATGLFGKSGFALLAIDADHDGDDDICYLKHQKKSPKTFTAICKDVVSSGKILKRKIGKFRAQPLKISVNNRDRMLLWRTKAKKGETKITLIDLANGEKSTATINAILDSSNSKPTVGDWLGTGSQQIGIANNGTLHIYDPLTQTSTTQAIPVGTALDCSNNLTATSSSVFLHSRNICRLVDCTRQ